MYNNEFDDISEKMDLYALLNLSDHSDPAEKQVITDLIKERFTRLEEQIMNGTLTIFDPNKVQDQIRLLRQDRMKKEKEMQSSQVQNNQQFARQLKREIITLRQQQIRLQKEESKLKKKQIMEQIKKWQEVQADIKSKKDAEDAERAKKQIQQDLREKKAEQQKEKQRRIKRKREAQLKLKQIEKNRRKREEILKFAQQQYSKLHPKYLEIEKKFKQIEDQQKFQEEILKKNHKLATKIDYNAIKAHQKQYMDKVEERNSKRQENLKSSSLTDRKTDFTPFVYRDEDKIQQQRSKWKRRHKFQQRIKSIPISINPQKRKQIEIAIDRGHNPLKYHFLSQKALTDEQIFEQFGGFEINLNPRELGKDYLKELPKITEASRVVKSNSEQALSVRDNTQRVRYKDYLNDLKYSRGPRNQPTDEQLLKLSSDQVSRNKILEKLANREKRYSVELQKRQQELQQYNGIKSSLKKTHQIDQIYKKSINAKLSMLQIKE